MNGSYLTVTMPQGPAGCMTPPPTNEAPITNAMRRMAGATERLSQAVSAVCDRLQPVLGPPFPAANVPGACNPQRPDTPLSEAIKDKVNAIENSTDTLNDILRRLGLE